jgi:hypothetical protein
VPDIMRAGVPVGRWVLLSRQGEEDVMAGAVTRPAEHARQFGRLWWLPSGGYGNELDDDSWAPALEVSEQVVPRVLSLLRVAGVPAYAAPARPAAGRLRDRSGQPAGYQLWVGASACGRAEATLLAAMPSVAREAADHADSAWR